MEKERFLINLFNKNGIKVNTFVANTIEDAECFAIAQIKASRGNTKNKHLLAKLRFMVIFKESLLCIPISKMKKTHEKGNISCKFFR